MNRAVIHLELIADDYFWHHKRGLLQPDQELTYLRKLGPNKSPSCVYRISGVSGNDFTREYVRGTRDYSQANSVGSRGIFCYYVLSDGFYEIFDRYKIAKVRHYFIRVTGEQIEEVPAIDVVRAFRCKNG